MALPSLTADRILVSAWRSTSAEKLSLTGMGLKIGFRVRDQWVSPGAKEVTLELEGQPIVQVKLTDAFWNKCPEFKHRAIGSWIEAQGLILPWPIGKPHRFPMERISGTQFRVFKTTTD